jgi:DNA-binding transcriptional LysR family regulator
MDLRQIESVVAVADELHFGRAADRLFVSTSVVSQHVARLERGLGVRLFERSTRNVRITGTGQSVLRHARAVLAAVEAMKCVQEPLPAQYGCGSRFGLLGQRIPRFAEQNVRFYRRVVRRRLADHRGIETAAIGKDIQHEASLRPGLLWTVDRAFLLQSDIARTVPLLAYPQ